VETIAPSPAAPFETAANIAQVVTAGAAVIALLGIVAVWLTATRARHAQLMADISRRWDEPLFVAGRKAAAKFIDEPWILGLYVAVHRDQQSDTWFELQRIPNFFEDLAVQRLAHAISFRIVREAFGWGLVTTWEQWKPAVWLLRLREKDATVYEHFEALAERMRESLSGYERGPGLGYGLRPSLGLRARSMAKDYPPSQWSVYSPNP